MMAYLLIVLGALIAAAAAFAVGDLLAPRRSSSHLRDDGHARRARPTETVQEVRSRADSWRSETHE